MSVIVKGRNMPRHCGECACSNYYDQIDALLCDFTEKQLDEKTWKKERHPDCPLVELPPHGRLIDADKIDFRNYAMHDGKGNLIVDNNFINGIVWANDCIDRTPTVIEAEGETE